jgi:hypothetical protein
LDALVTLSALNTVGSVAFVLWSALEVAQALCLVWDIGNNTLLLSLVVVSGLALEVVLLCNTPLNTAVVVLAQLWAVGLVLVVNDSASGILCIVNSGLADFVVSL